MASVLQHLKPWFATLSGSVLEVGCGEQPYRDLIPESCSYGGLEWEGSQQYFAYGNEDTTYYDGDVFPFQGESFDNVFHTEVLEHVYNTEGFLRECFRVLKPGGIMLFSVPFQARYHYIPMDFWRFTPAALERKLLEAGFADIQIKPRGNDITVAAYKMVSVFYRWLSGGVKQKLLGLAVGPIALFFLVAGHISLNIEIGSSDDCLGYTVTARKRA